ncbi:hypothetical protein [Butyrivibrio sp. FC2001]|uniref:hypothetical protein n=1 Tax=Butyrivibrio sp. FC2001 TaxID=1280671 RepID=UPI0004000BD7|nr:hypothetical protein [Butyrivibrio sp. FC2001]
MKRLVNVLLAMFLTVALFFAAVPMPAHAEFMDLKRSGVSFNLKPGNWTIVHTKLPGSKKFQKVFTKITKYKRVPLGGSSGTKSSSGSSGGNGVKVILTVQVQLPKRLSKKIAKTLQDRRNNNLPGDTYVDYLDVVYVDQRTGENLKTSVTDGAEGDNYKDAKVTETDWKPYKPQKVTWGGGSYSYYVSYAKSITIDFPTGYKKACVGVCGNCTSNYDKIQEWNQGFTDGYTVFSDTSHVKLGSKKKTAKICHMFKVK